MAAGLACALAALTCVAQSIDALKAAFPQVEGSVDPETQMPTRLRGLDLGTAQPARATALDAAVGFFNRFGASAFSALGNRLQVRHLQSARDPTFEGVTQVLLQQTFDNVDVYGATATVSVKERSAANFVVDSLSSGFKNIPPGFSVRPEIRPERARDVARADYATLLERSPGVARTERILVGKDAPQEAQPKLMVFVDESAAKPEPKLAYRVNVGSFQYFVDAASAAIIRRLRMANRLTMRETSDAMDKVDFQGQPVLADDKDLVSDVSAEARFSHGVLAKVHEYWAKRFSRRSYDGNGATLYLSARIGNWPEAMWFEKRAYFGTGYALAPEIVAHEFTHALIAALDRLKNHDESGALNESISDFYGVAIRVHITGRLDWKIGARVPPYSAEGIAMRDMSNPAQGMFDRTRAFHRLENNGQPSHYADRVSKSDPICSAFLNGDNGCVHLNSGIFSKGLYLVVEGGVHGAHTIGGIGLGKTEQILFRALKTKYLQLTRLKEGAQGFLEACRELFAATPGTSSSSECANAELAFRAVGLR